MRTRLLPLALVLSLVGCASSREEIQRPPAPKQVTRIAFGSCSSQAKPQPIWEAVNAARPDLFIYLGDNIYADTEDMAVMRRKYDLQLQVPGFAQLRKTVPVLATWDDHDYGVNDGGEGQTVPSQKVNVAELKVKQTNATN